MTGFRYHALALTTSVVTLAVGVVVGVGPLSQAQTTKHREQVAALQHRQAALTERLATAEARAGDDRSLAEALAGPLTADRLKARTVVVVAAPGADPALVRRTVADLKAAGATVTGTLSLTNVYVDPGKAQSPLEDLVLRLVPAGRGVHRRRQRDRAGRHRPRPLDGHGRRPDARRRRPEGRRGDRRAARARRAEAAGRLPDGWRSSPSWSPGRLRTAPRQ